ncbi:MAG: DegT/DnrJ/EryC1/StrS family aminotransferase [Anaerolineae bacterium]|nr:DegT/DnrJ/EryC1/StrS family aminotransferase [Anaerolineae bacterium]
MPRYPKLSITASRQLLRRITGREQVLLTGRGAAGIYAALVARQMQGKIVLLPANTCYIVLWAVLRAGAIPHLVDVDLHTGNLSLDRLESCLVDKPSAVIPCHMYGLPAPMNEIMEWAREHQLFVIEDAALALGAMVDGKPAGAWGDAAIFSFGLGKIADNELGGAFLTDNATLAADVERVLTTVPLWDDDLLKLTEEWHDAYWDLHQDEPASASQYREYFERCGALTFYRLPVDYWRDVPELLVNLPENLAHRTRLAALYDELLSGFSRSKREGAIWRYPLYVPSARRNLLLQHLWNNEVNATRWYPSLRPMLNALAPQLSIPPTPHADALADSIINLPLDASVDEAEVRRTANLILSTEA